MIRFEIIHIANDQYGGSDILNPIADLLTVRLGDFGKAIEAFEISAYMPIEDDQLGFLTYEEMPTVPKLRFARKAKKVFVKFLSQNFPANMRFERLLEPCNKAMVQFIEVISPVKDRIRPTDDFDAPMFVRDVERVLRQGYASLEEIKEVERLAEKLSDDEDD